MSNDGINSRRKNNSLHLASCRGGFQRFEDDILADPYICAAFSISSPSFVMALSMAIRVVFSPVSIAKFDGMRITRDTIAVLVEGW